MNNGKICIPVCAETVNEMIAKIGLAEKFADVIEVRFDCLADNELRAQMTSKSGARPWETLLGSTEKPIISTFRAKDQGGYRQLTWDDRREFWKSGPESQFCDLEEDFIEDSRSWLLGDRICSYHNFTGVPSNLVAIYERLAYTGAEIVKLAVHAHDSFDAIPVWKLIEKAGPAGKRIIPVAMGEAGKWTRILGLAHGAFLTYASLDTGDGTAPGQITAEDMIEVYRVKELDESTEVYGVIGDPISQSLSPYIHNPALSAAGLNAVYLPFLVEDIDEFLVRMVKPGTREVELNIRGFSVTMPHKESIIGHLDSIDPAAEAIGAVNTVAIENGRLIGYNTDAYGFMTPLTANFGDLRGARIAIFGAGGSARACVFALRQQNLDLTVFARDKQKARLLADEFDVRYDAISRFNDNGYRLGAEFDILVDTTPLGMAGLLENETLFRAEHLSGLKLVFDLVTRLTDTPIVREAKLAGVPAIGGLEMLLAQGARQFEIWTGTSAPVGLMRESALARIDQILK